MITYRIANDPADLRGILQLQQANLRQTVGEAVARAEGFVTLKHTLPLLRAMNADYGHSVASTEAEVVGYALMMQRHFGPRIPALAELLEQLAVLHWQGQPLSSYRYFIMGQVCVAQAFRGKGVFAGLYTHLCNRLAADFDLVVTEIAAHNSRSYAAHRNLGFVEVQSYQATDGQEWIIVGKHCQE